jgi:hypothetical protein
MQTKKEKTPSFDWGSSAAPAWGETEKKEDSFSLQAEEKETEKETEKEQIQAKQMWITCPICKNRSCPLGYFITVTG